MFSVGQIALSAAIGAVLSLGVGWVYVRWAKQDDLTVGQVVAASALTGVSILLWRLAGNTETLNQDPIPLVSPNDVLCPLVTYVMLGVYGQLTGQIARPAWGRLRALLTITAFVVNVVTI